MDHSKPNEGGYVGFSEAASLRFARSYTQLRRMGQSLLGAARGHSIGGTDLTDEAVLRLMQAAPYPNDAALFAAARTTMKRILIDRARAKAALKRAGRRSSGSIEDHADALECSDVASDQMFEVLEALEQLRTDHPEEAAVIDLELLDLGRERIASALGISVALVRKRSTIGRQLLRARYREDAHGPE